jgi:hypothetical protein
MFHAFLLAGSEVKIHSVIHFHFDLFGGGIADVVSAIMPEFVPFSCHRLKA